MALIADAIAEHVDGRDDYAHDAARLLARRLRVLAGQRTDPPKLADPDPS